MKSLQPNFLHVPGGGPHKIGWEFILKSSLSMFCSDFLFVSLTWNPMGGKKYQKRYYYSCAVLQPNVLHAPGGGHYKIWFKIWIFFFI